MGFSGRGDTEGKEECCKNDSQWSEGKGGEAKLEKGRRVSAKGKGNKEGAKRSRLGCSER